MHRSIALILSLAFGGAGLLPGSADAQTADMAFGASYSTLYGSTGRMSLTAEGLGDADLSSTIYYRGGETGEEARFSLRWTPEVASGELIYDVTIRLQDWDHIPYESRGARASVMREFAIHDQLAFGIGAFATQDDVTAVAANTSAILARDFGQSTSFGAQALIRYTAGDFDPKVAETRRLKMTANFSVAGLADRDYAAVEVGARFEQPILRGVTFAAEVNAGAVRGLDGGYVSILDRAFQGDTEPRGFEYGGLGPRDPVTQDALGGTNYYWGSIEVNWQIPETPITVGSFVDFGSTWSLPGVSAPQLMDDHSLRASAGISIEIESAIGNVRLSVAEPFERERFDRAQQVSVALVARF